MRAIKKTTFTMFGLALLFLGILMLQPNFAEAVDYPGVQDGEPVTEDTTASTEVGLKIDDSQLCFTAPAIINFALMADGSFKYPTDNLAKFTNNSVFDLKVVQYEIASDSVAKGYSSSGFSSATDANAYKLSVKPNGGTAVDFAVTNKNLSATEWKVPCGSSANTLGLSFSNGQMKNVSGSIWTTGHKLQQVLWTLSAA